MINKIGVPQQENPMRLKFIRFVVQAMLEIDWMGAVPVSRETKLVACSDTYRVTEIKL